MKGKRGNPGLKGRLVNKSVEAYVLALETINRLSIQYRIETFCYLICNAWELLLKAKILENERKHSSIYYNTGPGQPKKSLSLRDCLNRIIPNQTDPIRRNIERVGELRDEAVHLVIGQIPSEIISLFQASVINYHKYLTEWFGVSLSDRVHIGMMSIVYDMSPEQSDMTDKRLRRKLGLDAATFLARYCSEIKHEFDELQRPAQFSIGIEYRLALTKKHDGADIALSSGLGGEQTRVIEVPKDPSTSHPFRQKEVIEKINKAISELQINQYDIQCVNKVHHIRRRSEYFYRGKIKGSPGQYSQPFVDWLIERYRQNKQFFTEAKTKVRTTNATELGSKKS